MVEGPHSQDAEISHTATAALPHEPQLDAQAHATTLRAGNTAPAAPTPTEREDTAAATLAAFEGIALDAEAQAAILAALTACAERHRTQSEEDNPETTFVPAGSGITTYIGALESPLGRVDDAPLPEGERPWQTLGDEAAHAAIDEAVARIHAHQALPEAERLAIEAEWDAEADRQRARNQGLNEDEREERSDWRNWTED